MITVELNNFQPDGSPTKLGHEIAFLPHGIIDKTITGLGGTTLELDCNRPSIVVEPYNYTAQSKSNSPSLTNQYILHFFQSKHSRSQNTTALEDLLTLDSKQAAHLKKYLKQCKERQQPPKLLCIPDQLSNLKKAIEQSKLYKFEDFHLLFDEIDSMQEQITFRKIMHEVAVLYKQHPVEKRTLLSATISTFNDPELQNEQFTRYKYKQMPVVQGILHCTKNIVYRTKEVILKLRQEHPEDKIVVAYNHIEGIEKCIEKLVREAPELVEHIGVLSSNSRKSQFGELYQTMNKNMLPKQINFITAAYFNGHDINEQAHLVTCVDAITPSMNLSNRVLYQISGRLRPGTLSVQWVAHFVQGRKNKNTLENLTEAADAMKKTMDLVHFYKKKKDNPYLLRHAESIEHIFYNGHDAIRPIWVDYNGRKEVSYFMIDSILEESNTRAELNSIASFKKAIQSYFEIIEHIDYKDDKEPKPDNTVEECLRALKELKTRDLSLRWTAKMVKALKTEYPTTHARKLIEIYREVSGKAYWKYEVLHSTVAKLLQEVKWKSKLDLLQIHIKYHNHFTMGTNKELRQWLALSFKHIKRQPTKEFNRYCTLQVTKLIHLSEQKDKKLFDMAKKLQKHSTLKGALMTLKSATSKTQTILEIQSLNPYGLLDLKILPELNIRIKSLERPDTKKVKGEKVQQLSTLGLNVDPAMLTLTDVASLAVFEDI